MINSCKAEIQNIIFLFQQLLSLIYCVTSLEFFLKIIYFSVSSAVFGFKRSKLLVVNGFAQNFAQFCCAVCKIKNYSLRAICGQSTVQSHFQDRVLLSSGQFLWRICKETCRIKLFGLMNFSLDLVVCPGKAALFFVCIAETATQLHGHLYGHVWASLDSYLLLLLHAKPPICHSNIGSVSCSPAHSYFPKLGRLMQPRHFFQIC